MHLDQWRRAAQGMYCRHADLPARIAALQDGDSDDLRELLWDAAIIVALADQAIWLLSLRTPLAMVYTEPVALLTSARLATEAVGERSALSPAAQRAAVAGALELTANTLYGVCLLVQRVPHLPAKVTEQLFVAGEFFAIPAVFLSHTFRTLRGLADAVDEDGPGPAVLFGALVQAAQLLARLPLHLLCIAAYECPSPLGLPSPRLTRDPDPAPWPGWDAWLERWSERFPA